MKKLSKLPASLLALALLLSLAACSGGSKIAGVWTCTMDVKKAMEASGDLSAASDDASSEEAQALQDVLNQMCEGVTMQMVLNLKEDDSYTLKVDETSAKAAADAMQSNLSAILPNLLSAMFNVPVDQLDDALSSLGVSLDEMIRSTSEQFNVQELVDQLAQNGSKGSYRFEDGKLYLTEEGKTEDAAQYLTVELGENEFKVTETNGVEAFKDLAQQTPLVFTK